MSLQQHILSETIVGEDSSNPLNVVYHDTSGNLVIDYSKYYERIAHASETISANIAKIEAHQKQLLDLANGNGIHIISPLDLLSFISTYKFLIEGGEILKDGPAVTEKSLDKANKRISDYISKINALPKAF
jgi:hypothetical protein